MKIACLLLLAPLAYADIPIAKSLSQARSSANITSYTFSHTAPANMLNSVTFVGCNYYSTTRTISSVAFGSDTFNFYNLNGDSGATGISVELWYRVAPTAQTANINVTFSGAIGSGNVAHCFALTMTNVDQTTPVEAANTVPDIVGGTHASHTSSVTVATDRAWVLSMIGYGNKATANINLPGGLRLFFDASLGGGGGAGYHANIAAGSYSETWNFTSGTGATTVSLWAIKPATNTLVTTTRNYSMVATLGGLDSVTNPIYVGETVGDVALASWKTVKTFKNVDVKATFTGAPGSGNSYEINLEYAPVTVTQDCPDVTVWNHIPVGTISGATQKQLAVTNVQTNIVGPACIRGHINLYGGTRANILGGTMTISFGNSATNEVHYEVAENTANGSTGTLYGGNHAANTGTDREYWLAPGMTLTSVTGLFLVDTAPGAGKTWAVSFDVSTSAITTTANCADLSYTNTGTVATLSNPNKSITVPATSISVPANGCVRMVATGSGTPATLSHGFKGAFEFTAGTSNVMTFQSAGSGAFDGNHDFKVCHWAIGDPNCALLRDQQYWIVPAGGINGVAGGFTLTANTAGSGQFDVGVRYSTTALDSTHACDDLTYTESSTYCSIANGQRACMFNLQNVTIPENYCFALNVKSSGGSPTNAGQFNWQANTTYGAGYTPKRRRSITMY